MRMGWRGPSESSSAAAIGARAVRPPARHTRSSTPPGSPRQSPGPSRSSSPSNHPPRLLHTPKIAPANQPENGGDPTTKVYQADRGRRRVPKRQRRSKETGTRSGRHQFAYSCGRNTEILRHPCRAEPRPDGCADHAGLRRRDVRPWRSVTNDPCRCRGFFCSITGAALFGCCRSRLKGAIPRRCASPIATRIRSIRSSFSKLSDIPHEIGEVGPPLLTRCLVTIP